MKRRKGNKEETSITDQSKGGVVLHGSYLSGVSELFISCIIVEALSK